MSICVEYDNWGRAGNRMFQYAFGKVLSHIKNVEIYNDALPNFGVVENKPTNFNAEINTKSFGNHYADLDLLISADKNILVNSFLQKARYYTAYRELIKKWFNIPEFETTNKDKLVVHVRETDYNDLGVFLGYDFYKQLINESSFTDIIIVTDNSNCDTVKRLQADGCNLSSSGYVSVFDAKLDERGNYDFNVLLKSENIIISQSSFSWWAAFLGKHSKIIFPYTANKSMWQISPDKDDIDLYFDFGQSERYIN